MSLTQHIEEIKTILKRAGLTNKQIASYLLDLDARLQACLIDDSLNQLSSQQQAEYEKMIENNAHPQELAEFLKLKRQELQQKIEGYFKKFKEETLKQYLPQK